MANKTANTNKTAEMAKHIWDILDSVLHLTFKRNELGDVLLPFVVLRRMDCILAPYNENVYATHQRFFDKLTEDKLVPVLRKAAGDHKFYNTSRFTLQTLLDDAPNIDLNFRAYINGFSREVQEILKNFNFDATVAKLLRHGILYAMVQKMANLDMSPAHIDDHDMGSMFEEVIRLANESSNETAGEHFTPRDAIRLMCALMFEPDKETLCQQGTIRTIYDPTCGTGGMMNLGKNYIRDIICAESDNKPTINTFGQELNEVAYAIAKSEAMITGVDSNNIQLGNTLTDDKFPTKRFSYIMANPPYGITWKIEQAKVMNESLDPNGRFSAGLPRVSDGQLLFLQHMINKMDPAGSKIAVVTNGSPLFSGGAGSGESNIRKWILDNDWLDCIVALPKDLFYNTGIATYIWFLSNRKPAERCGKVQLIDATSFCRPVAKSLGSKRNEITEEHVQQILAIYNRYEESDYCRIFPVQEFGALQITVEQPLRDEHGKLKLKKGEKQPDKSKTDTETVRLDQDLMAYFHTEVLPHIDPEAWIDFTKTRYQYEINFTRYFYKFQALEPAATIAARVQERQKELMDQLNAIFA